MNFYPIINRHAAWLVANPIQGCPNNCKYCFLQSVNGTKIKPNILCSPEETIKEITSSSFYISDIPLCLFSQTDIFSTKQNIQFLDLLIDKLLVSEIYNPLVLITKCKIPEDIINRLIELRSSGRQVVVYLSYSGIDTSIEQGINVEVIRENFQILHNNRIPVIHYFRPIIPQNGTFEKIDEIIDYVSKYARASVVAGLKIERSYIKNLDFWQEIALDNEIEYAECVWPTNSKDYLKQIAAKYNYPIYETNSCALSYVLGSDERYGFYDTKMCKTFNHCPIERHKKCKKDHITPDISSITTKLSTLLQKIHKPGEFQCSIEKGILFIQGIELTIEETCFLSGELHIRVDSTLKKQGFYWNTSISDTEGIQK